MLSYRSNLFGGQVTLQQITEMQEKVGSILYAAVVSRPDVSFVASQLSQFATNPSPVFGAPAICRPSPLMSPDYEVLCYRVLGLFERRSRDGQ